MNILLPTFEGQLAQMLVVPTQSLLSLLFHLELVPEEEWGIPAGYQISINMNKQIQKGGTGYLQARWLV